MTSLTTAGGTANAVVGGDAVVSILTVNNSGMDTYGGLLGGTGTNNNNLALTMSGSGTLTLTGANTYSDGTTVNAGTLTVSGVGATLGATTGTLAVNNPNTSAGTATVLNLSTTAATTSGSLSGTIATPSSGTNTATINNGGQLFTVNQTADGAYAGVITGAGGFTLGSGSGSINTLTLSGINTYTGATTISGGILSTGSLGNGGAASGIGQSSNAAANLILNGGTLQYANSSSATSTDRLFTLTNLGGTLDASGTNTITFAGNGVGPSNAIAYSGSGARTLTLTGMNAGMNTLAPILADGTGGKTALTKSGSGTWVVTGANTYSGATTSSGGTLKAGSTQAFGINSAVTLGTANSTYLDITGFSNSIGSLTGGASNGGNVILGGATLTVGSDNTSPAAYAGRIVDGSGSLGTGGLTKIGNGTLTLSGANIYTGVTNLNGGILNVGKAETAGTSGPLGKSAAANAGSIVFGGGTLQYSSANQNDYSGRFSTSVNQAYSIDTNSQNVTFGTALTSNGGSLTKSGAGTLTLTGANTYSGGTIVNGGTLTVSGVGATLGATTGTLAVNNPNTSAGTATVLNLSTTAATTSGSLSGTIATPSSGTNTATINNGGQLFTVNQTADGAYAGVIAGSGGFTLGSLSTNTLTLSGANTYSGGTNIQSGTLQLGTLSGTTVGSLSSTGAVTLGNSTSSGIFQLGDASNAVNQTISSLTTSGTGTANAVIGSNGSISTLTVNNSSADNYGGILGGAGINNNLAFTKTGAGTLTFSGTAANTYAGLTTISAGEMDLSKTAGVNAIGGNVTINGGTLKLLASNQIADTSTLGISSGALNFNNFSETIKNLNVLGGTVSYGTGAVNITDPTWSGGTNTVSGPTTFGELTVSGGTNLVTTGGNLTVGGATDSVSGDTDLTFSGTGSPIITVNSDSATPGKITLAGNITSQNTSGTASIASGGSAANAGQLDLGGATRTVSVSSGTVTTPGLAVSTQVINGGLLKTGAGTLTLSGTNTYAGLTTVSGGTLAVSSTGSLFSGNALTIGAGGTATFANSNQTLGAVSNSDTTANSLNFSAASSTSTLASLTGGGKTSFASNGSVTGSFDSGTATVGGNGTFATINGGAATVGGTSTVGTLSGGSLTNNGTAGSITALNGGALTVGSGDTTSVSSGTDAGTITGSGSLTKTGAGTLTLSGTGNTYSGGTTVSGGKFAITNASGSATGSAGVTVSGGNGAVFSGTGISSGALSVTNGSVLAPGSNSAGNFNGAGTLTVGNAGGATLNSAMLDFDLSSATAAVGTANDLIKTNTLSLGPSVTFDFNEAGGSLLTGTQYTLFQDTGAISGFNASNISTLFNNGQTYTPTYSVTGNNLDVMFGSPSAAPEPGETATLSLIGLGLGGLLLRAFKRRTAAVSQHPN